MVFLHIEIDNSSNADEDLFSIAAIFFSQFDLGKTTDDAPNVLDDPSVYVSHKNTSKLILDVPKRIICLDDPLGNEAEGDVHDSTPFSDGPPFKKKSTDMRSA